MTIQQRLKASKNVNFAVPTVSSVTPSRSMRRRVRTPEEQLHAQYKHVLVSIDRYEGVQNEE